MWNVCACVCVFVWHDRQTCAHRRGVIPVPRAFPATVRRRAKTSCSAYARQPPSAKPDLSKRVSHPTDTTRRITTARNKQTQHIHNNTQKKNCENSVLAHHVSSFSACPAARSRLRVSLKSHRIAVVHNTHTHTRAHTRIVCKHTRTHARMSKRSRECVCVCGGVLPLAFSSRTHFRRARRAVLVSFAGGRCYNNNNNTISHQRSHRRHLRMFVHQRHQREMHARARTYVECVSTLWCVRSVQQVYYIPMYV